MELNVKSLQEAGAFTGAPVEKEIKWKQGDKELSATAFIRKLSYKTAVSDAKQYGKEVIAGRIAACVCNKDGSPVFTTEDITGESTPERGPLDHNLTVALLDAIIEVNSMSGEAMA